MPTVIGVAARRLRAQRLTGKPLPSPVDAVRWLGAVQAQDYAGAKWALGQRSRATDAGIDRLFDEGAILRTHLLRPTWHFVVPDDIRWLIGLTGARIRAGLAARYRELELDDRVVARATAAFAAAMAGGRHLTRAEVGQVLRAARISPEGQRLPHLIMRAELDALVVSGPRRGKQFTYALLEERVPKTRVLERTEAVVELTHRYFRSHGPAQLQDFVWWSGLTTSDAKMGISRAGAALEHRLVDGTDYWYDAEAAGTYGAEGVAHLLPNFDEYTVGYRDRAALIHADHPFEPALHSFGSVLSNVVLVGGSVRGSWRRRPARGKVVVEVRTPHRFSAMETKAVEAVGRRMGRFFQRGVDVLLTFND